MGFGYLGSKLKCFPVAAVEGRDENLHFALAVGLRFDRHLHCRADWQTRVELSDGDLFDKLILDQDRHNDTPGRITRRTDTPEPARSWCASRGPRVLRGPTLLVEDHDGKS